MSREQFLSEVKQDYGIDIWVTDEGGTSRLNPLIEKVTKKEGEKLLFEAGWFFVDCFEEQFHEGFICLPPKGYKGDKHKNGIWWRERGHDFHDTQRQLVEDGWYNMSSMDD